MAKREPREISFAAIRNVFTLAGLWWGDRWSPAVEVTDDGYSVRVIRSVDVKGINVSTTYDYFELAADGLVLVAPRGHAKDFRPCRVVDIAEVAKQFALPPGGRCGESVPQANSDAGDDEVCSAEHDAGWCPKHRVFHPGGEA